MAWRVACMITQNTGQGFSKFMSLVATTQHKIPPWKSAKAPLKDLPASGVLRKSCGGQEVWYCLDQCSTQNSTQHGPPIPRTDGWHVLACSSPVLQQLWKSDPMGYPSMLQHTIPAHGRQMRHTKYVRTVKPGLCFEDPHVLSLDQKHVRWIKVWHSCCSRYKIHNETACFADMKGIHQIARRLIQ